MPATLVEIALNAELDFGSQVSTWLGPPSSHSRMAACAFPPDAPVAAAARRLCARSTPRNPSEPTRRKSRREAWPGFSLRHPLVRNVPPPRLNDSRRTLLSIAAPRQSLSTRLHARRRQRPDCESYSIPRAPETVRRRPCKTPPQSPDRPCPRESTAAVGRAGR